MLSKLNHIFFVMDVSSSEASGSRQDRKWSRICEHLHSIHVLAPIALPVGIVEVLVWAGHSFAAWPLGGTLLGAKSIQPSL